MLRNSRSVTIPTRLKVLGHAKMATYVQVCMFRANFRLGRQNCIHHFRFMGFLLKLRVTSSTELLDWPSGPCKTCGTRFWSYLRLWNWTRRPEVEVGHRICVESSKESKNRRLLARHTVWKWLLLSLNIKERWPQTYYTQKVKRT